MQRLDTLPALDFANERRGDVFSLEFPNRWDARRARRAAELDDDPRTGTFARPTLATGLAALSHRLGRAGRRRTSAD